MGSFITTMAGLSIIIAILAFVVIYFLVTYNSLIRKRNNIKQAYSAIDVYLTQRFELIPNLVECVKGYMEYEKNTLDEIVEKRTAYLNNKNLKDGEELNKEVNQIVAVAEKYPELKASEQFLHLQKSLNKMESQLQAARRIYNVEVNTYNNVVQMFPSSLIANMFSFKEEEYFEAEENAKSNIKIGE